MPAEYPPHYDYEGADDDTPCECGAPMTEDEARYGACIDCAHDDHAERQADAMREEGIRYD